MSTVHVQHIKPVISSTASILSSGCVTQIFDTRGYKTLRGIVYTGCTISACAVRVFQNAGSSTSEDANYYQTYFSASVSASGASAYEAAIYGSSADVLITPGTCNVNPLRVYFYLLPI